MIKMSTFKWDGIVLALAVLTLVAAGLVHNAKAQTQPTTTNPMEFFIPYGSDGIAAGVTEDKTFCSTQGNSSIGGSISWPAGAFNFFRIGNNLATVNSLGAVTVTRWQFATATGNDLTAGDLTATFNVAGKIVLTNTSGVARDLTHGMTVCVVANITAVGSPIHSIVDNSNNLTGTAYPREHVFSVY